MRQGLWKLAIAGLYAHALAEGSEAVQDNAVSFLDKMRDFLPGVRQLGAERVAVGDRQ